MDHSVQLAELAYDELDRIVGYIAQNAPETALRWRDALLKEVATLSYFPLRHGLTPEAEAVGLEVRQMMFGTYRVLYTVEESCVTVQGFRHGARRPLRTEVLPGQA